MQTWLIILLAVAAIAGWTLFAVMVWLWKECTKGWGQIYAKHLNQLWRERVVRDMYAVSNRSMQQALAAMSAEILRLRQALTQPEDPADWWKENKG